MAFSQESIKWMNRFATVASLVVLIVVVLMRRIKIESSIDFSFLPPFYSFLNALAAVVLIIAFFQIKEKNITGHKRSMIIALSISFLFLVCYVVYHITTAETKYCGEGISRLIYFVLLISHIILAAVSFPFILFTFIKGYTMQIDSHRKLAKYVFPVWLYVCISGPVCYLMLMPCYAK